VIYKIEEAGKNFIFHWFVYMVGALKNVDLSSKIDVCFDAQDYTAYQKETFELLSDLINVVPYTENSTLIPQNAPTNIVNGSGRFHVDPTSYSFLRELFLSRVGGFDTTGYENIYICRSKAHLCEGNRNDRNSRRRHILNESELVESLEKRGFKAIHFEDYTISEKVQIFNNAKRVIAPQSGGLVFSLFASPTTEIVEIYPPNPHQYCDQYIDICRVLGIPFKRFTDVAKVDRCDNMTVQPDKLINFIQQ